MFKGRHDGILDRSEQAQTLRAPAERMAFHSGAGLASTGHYEICRWKFPKNLSKSEFSIKKYSPGCYDFKEMSVNAEQQIHIEQLKVLARVGVPRAERAKRQRLVLNITLWPKRDLRSIQDQIVQTVDYSAVCQAAKKFLSGRAPKLIETLANDLASHLLSKFRIRKVSVEIRKFVLKDAAYAAVTVARSSSVD